MELYALNEEIEMLRTDIFNAIMHADELVILPPCRTPQMLKFSRWCCANCGL